MFMFKSYISPTRSHSAMEYKIYHAAISQQPFHSSASAHKQPIIFVPISIGIKRIILEGGAQDCEV